LESLDLDLEKDKITPEFLTDDFLDAWNTAVPASVKSRFKNSLLEYYRSLEMLINFKTLNVTGFYKITKKFDRYTHSKCQSEIMSSIMQTSWMKSQFAENTVISVENLFALLFCASDKARALNVLRLQKAPSESDYSIGYRVGFFVGLSVLFSVLIVKSLCCWSDDNRTHHFEYILKVFIPMFIPIFMLWGMVVNLWLWRSFGINYPFIFGFNPRKYLNIHQVMDLISVFMAIWTFGCWLCIDHDLSKVVSLGKQPFILILVTLVLLIWPFRILYRSARYWLVSVLVSLLMICFLLFMFVTLCL
jgi:hypothetical protein